MAATIPARGRGKNKQFWKDEEVEALVDTLQELVADPYWKVDGGFKNNYMVEVHKMMATKVPNFDKEVDPHINSKIKWLREKYNQISEMLMQSGCQWDDVEQKINCEKQWFDDWCLNHKNVVGLWNFRFPYLHKLDMVWGRDRATGHKAEDIADVQLVCRVATVLLQIHHNQLTSTVSARPILSLLKDILHARVKECKDTLGFNLAAMDHLKQLMDAKSDAPFRDAKNKLMEICARYASQHQTQTKGERRKKKKQKKLDDGHVWS
ncbi:hypothetical protein ACS0TY_031741 [Phlomoides rotata]